MKDQGLQPRHIRLYTYLSQERLVNRAGTQLVSTGVAGPTLNIGYFSTGEQVAAAAVLLSRTCPPIPLPSPWPAAAKTGALMLCAYTSSIFNIQSIALSNKSSNWNWEIQKKTRWSPFRNSRRRGWPGCFQSTAENSYHFCTSVLWLISLEDEPQKDLEGEGTQGWPCLFPSSRKPGSFSGLPYFIKPLLCLCPEPQALVVLSE